jgi:hypothetical protein
MNNLNLGEDFDEISAELFEQEWEEGKITISKCFVSPNTSLGRL